jgi:GNAT superfamily N-acetyltransferase
VPTPVPATPSSHPPVRRATGADAPELARLRGLMLGAMGVPDAADPAWLADCAVVFAERIATPDFLALVVDGDGGGLAASGCAWLDRHLPRPGQLSGLVGHIASMSTEPGHRRRGYAAAVFAGLVDWLRAQGVPSVDLHATEQGRPLYTRFGFTSGTGMELRFDRP